jgi:hypothetical protein
MNDQRFGLMFLNLVKIQNLIIVLASLLIY